MKYLKVCIGIIGFLLIIMVGCKKSDNKKSSSNSTLLLGKWYYTADTLNQYSDGKLLYTYPNAESSSDYLQFNSDGSGYSSGSNIIDAFTYKVSGEILTINAKAFVVGGTNIPASTTNLNIVILTGSNLKLYSDTTEVGNGIKFRETQVSYLTRH
jgi:hypothetical protein